MSKTRFLRLKERARVTEMRDERGESIGGQRSELELPRWKTSVARLSEVKGASKSFRGERRAWRVYRRSKERARVTEVKDERGESIGGDKGVSESLAYRGERRAWRVYRRSKEQERDTEVKDERDESIGGQRSKREFSRWKTSVVSLLVVKGASESFRGKRWTWWVCRRSKERTRVTEVRDERSESFGGQRFCEVVELAPNSVQNTNWDKLKFLTLWHRDYY